MLVRSLGLSRRAANALRFNGIRSVEELAVLSDDDILRIRGIGVGILSDIRAKIPAPELSSGQGIRSKVLASADTFDFEAGEPILDGSDLASLVAAGWDVDRTYIWNINLPLGTQEALKADGIFTLRDLHEKTPSRLNFGHRRVDNIRAAVMIIAEMPGYPSLLPGQTATGDSQWMEAGPNSQLREIRVRRGFGLGAVAAKVGVARHVVSQWEHGLTPIPGECIALLAAALAVPPAALAPHSLSSSGGEESATGSIEDARTFSLLASIAALGMSRRDLDMLRARFGPGTPATLEKIGEDANLTRERVRQITAKWQKRLRQSSRLLAPSLDVLEKAARVTQTYPNIADPVDRLSQRGALALVEAGWQDATPAMVVQVITLTRAQLAAGSPDAEQRWPRWTFEACMLDRAILQHSQVGSAIFHRDAMEAERNRKWTYSELAEVVLEGVGTALHWSVIADHAERIGHRVSFSSTALYNAVSASHEKFVLVGQGTYALAAWGLSKVTPYTDLIARALRRSGRPMAVGAILQDVEASRPIKRVTLQLLLDLHPRYYKSKELTYGLRAWLPPQHKQNLLTPAYLVETAESRERVARGEARGYDIAKLVDQDTTRASC